MEENDNRWRKILLSGGARVGAATPDNPLATNSVDNQTNQIGGER